MRIVVIGPTLLTRRCLEAILEKADDEVAAVFALTNKHALKKARFAVFDDLAERYKFKLYKVDDINDNKNVEEIKKINPDLILELGWSQILSGKIIKIPKKGCVGVHAAMLPKNRGGASLNWALIKGEKDWGISLYYLDEKVDTGKVIAQKALKIDGRDTITTLHDKSDAATIKLLTENLPLIRNDKVKVIKQDDSQATYLSTRKPIEGFIIWDKTAKEIYNLIRALSGDFGGAFVFLNDKKLFIWQAEIGQNLQAGLKAGQIIDISEQEGIFIQTGEGALLLKRTQLEGDVPMSADDFARKYNLEKGDYFGGSLKFKDEVKNWLFDSGIQNADGGFNAWYDLKSNSYPYIYSEITGYGITALLYLDSITNAVKAADWIIKHALLDSGAVLARKYSDSWQGSRDYSFESGDVFSFDTGMVLFGMVNLFKHTGKGKYLKTAKRIANFLLTMQKKDGLFNPIYHSKADKFDDRNDKWSTQAGSFHAKLSLGLLAAYDITGEKKYQESAIKICDATFKFQEADGRFITSRDEGTTHLHPHCYSCEGLYYAGKKLESDAYMKAAFKGIIWALKNQLLDGGMPCIYDKNTGFNRNQRSDTLAQVLRLAIYFLADGAALIQDYKSNIYNLASKLLSFQKTEGKQAGGFYYGYTEDGKRMDHINSWCSMFALQSLRNLDDYLNNRKLSIDYLI